MISLGKCYTIRFEKGEVHDVCIIGIYPRFYLCEKLNPIKERRYRMCLLKNSIGIDGADGAKIVKEIKR